MVGFHTIQSDDVEIFNSKVSSFLGRLPGHYEITFHPVAQVDHAGHYVNFIAHIIY